MVEAGGAVDEAQAALGLARAHVTRGSDLDELLVGLERDLWVMMAEMATAPEHRDRRAAVVTAGMVSRLEGLIDDVTGRFEPPSEFVVPGQSVLSAHLDLARTVVRRAERHALAVVPEGSLIVPYLNRLSDLCWALAREQEDGALPARPPPVEETP